MKANVPIRKESQIAERVLKPILPLPQSFAPYMSEIYHSKSERCPREETDIESRLDKSQSSASVVVSASGGVDTSRCSPDAECHYGARWERTVATRQLYPRDLVQRSQYHQAFAEAFRSLP